MIGRFVRILPRRSKKRANDEQKLENIFIGVIKYGASRRLTIWVGKKICEILGFEIDDIVAVAYDEQNECFALKKAKIAEDEGFFLKRGKDNFFIDFYFNFPFTHGRKKADFEIKNYENEMILFVYCKEILWELTGIEHLKFINSG